MTLDVPWTPPLWIVIASAMILMFAAIESGFRVGRRVRHRATHETDRLASELTTPAIGLLGLILAFTFGWAANRFDARRSARVNEAQAIARLFRLSDFLPPQDRDHLRGVIREYITVSLAVRDNASLTQALRKRELMHHALWGTVVTAGNANPNSNVIAQFVTAANDVLDMHLSRSILAVSSSIPLGITGSLYVILALTMGMLGYQIGLSGSPRPPALIPLVGSIATILLLIADLDRPLEGLLHVREKSLIELQREVEVWK